MQAADGKQSFALPSHASTSFLLVFFSAGGEADLEEKEIQPSWVIDIMEEVQRERSIAQAGLKQGP